MIIYTISTMYFIENMSIEHVFYSMLISVDVDIFITLEAVFKFINAHFSVENAIIIFQQKNKCFICFLRFSPAYTNK